MIDPPRLLFVDDDAMLLSGVQRTMRQLRRAWPVRCASSGADALVELQENTTDCVISDMRMPEMDGASLLDRVAVARPDTLRFILSGQTEPEAALRSVLVAHQFFSKPCPPATIVTHVERAHEALHRLSPETRVRILALDRLPCHPLALGRLRTLLVDERPIDDVADVIVTDLGMTTKVLQLVCSSYFGDGCGGLDPRLATRRLGRKIIGELVAARAFDLEGGRSALRTEHDPLEPALAAMLEGMLDLGGDLPMDAACAFLAVWGIP